MATAPGMVMMIMMLVVVVVMVVVMVVVVLMVLGGGDDVGTIFFFFCEQTFCVRCVQPMMYGHQKPPVCWTELFKRTFGFIQQVGLVESKRTAKKTCILPQSSSFLY